MNKARRAALLTACAAGLAATSYFSAMPASGQEGESPDLGGMLYRGLQGVEGCIKVEFAQTQQGRNCIFAWFENKDAVKEWFYSDAHQGVIKMFVPDFDTENHVPMRHIADDTGPIMVIASIVYTDQNQVEGIDLPISDIAIELYQPLPGGAYAGSSFGPPEIYEHMKGYPMAADAD